MRNGDDRLSLSAGGLALELAPQLGGSVAALTLDGIHLLRPTPPQAIAQGLVRATSAFPLVPYSNRIAQARFCFAGGHRLARNAEPERHALHGNGWQRPWSVADASTSSCTLALDHAPAGTGPDGADAWPFAYRATQRFGLTADSLTVTLSVENTDVRPQPMGLGWHPFFPVRSDTTLAFRAMGVWMTDAEYLPTTHLPVTPGGSLGRGRPVSGLALNHCFTGWDGQALIGLGTGLPTLRIEAEEPLSMAIVYMPAGRDFFAFEPVSHMPDAVNRMEAVPDHGLRILAPGQTLTGEIRLTVR
jgi:aldose 1-epimerase